MLRVSGFGQDGPYKNRPGFGTIAEAMSGIVHITGFPDGPPILPAIPLADIVAGLFGTFSVMFAIYHRDVKGTGEGQYIDLSLYEPLFRMIVPQVIQYDQLNEVRERYGNRFPFAAPRNLYKTKDNKWVALSASAQAIFERVMKAIDKEELIEDSRFQDNESRVKNVEELDEIIGKWIGSHSMAEVLERFEEYEAVIGPVYDVSMMFEDPHYKARGNIMEFEDPELGKVKMQNVIPKFSRTPGKIESTGPRLGEHNEEIYLGRLGYTKEELSQLEERGIV
jgi:formyl-CoA transferase